MCAEISEQLMLMVMLYTTTRYLIVGTCVEGSLFSTQGRFIAGSAIGGTCAASFSGFYFGLDMTQ